MEIEKGIKTRWENDATLNGLLNVEDVSEGILEGAGDKLPFAVIKLPGGSIDTRMNDASQIHKVNVDVLVYHKAYAEGLAIANRVMVVFGIRGVSFSLTGSDNVAAMMSRQPVAKTKDPRSGVWSFQCRFEAKVLLASGA